MVQEVEVNGDREIDARIEREIFKTSGVGHYGPTKAHGTHLDQVLCDSHEAAMELYKKYWPEGQGKGYASWKAVDDTLGSWEDGWGTLAVPSYSRYVDDAWEIMEKLRGDGLTVRLEAFPDSAEQLEPPYPGAPGPEWKLVPLKQKYLCVILEDQSENGGLIVAASKLAHTPAMAICLATLQMLDRIAERNEKKD